MNFSEWESQGVELSKTNQAQKWALADWLAAGDTAWGGQAYNKAQELFPDLSRKYLFTLAYVGRNVPFSCRKEKLSFTHHELVAALEPVEQERVLQKAVTEGWTVARLKKYLRDVVLQESPFTLSLEKGLFAQLDAFARTVKVSPESIAARAISLFLANPPADLSAEYQKEVEAERERRRLGQEHHEQWLADREKEREQLERENKERRDFDSEIQKALSKYGDGFRRCSEQVQHAWSDLFSLANSHPQPSLDELRAQFTELLNLAEQPTEAADAACRKELDALQEQTA
jgi:hypothetical protein